MIATIIILTFLVAILFALIGFLVSHWFVKPKNNPEKARIYVEGIDRPYEATLAYSSQNGDCYTYQKNQTFVFVPRAYKVDFHYYKRTIYLDRLGALIAIPQGDGKPLGNSAKEELIKELNQSHIGSEAIKAIKGKSTFGMTIILIILAVALIAGAIGYAISMSVNKTKVNQPTQSQQVPSGTQLPPVIVK